MPYQAGDILLNKYRVESLVGRGAFGEVYHVTHIKMGVPRAIKVLRRDAPGVGSQDFQIIREQLTFEAGLGGRLNHPNVIQVHEFEEDEGELFLIMEYAPGGSLEDRLKERGQLSVDEVVQMGLDLCKGLRTIYEELKAVHRDLKPSNILFGEDGTAKIADLGFAQVPDDQSRRSLLGSLAGTHPGTPMYMSPEQAASRDFLQPTSDIFSLGCVLFEALTGIAYKREYGTRVCDHRSEVPARLDDIIARALAEQPGRVYADDEDKSKRYRNIEHLHKAIQQGWEKGKGQKRPERLRTLFERIPRFGWAFGIGVLFILLFVFVIRGITNTLPTMTPTAHTEAAVVEIDPTSTITKTPTPTATQTPTNTIVITPSSTQTISPTFTETITPTATLTPTVSTMVMIHFTTYSRTGPGYGYPILTTVSKGDELTVEGRSQDGDWLYVLIWKGLYGWILTEAVEEFSVIATVEVYSPIPFATDSSITYSVTLMNFMKSDSGNVYLDNASIGRISPQGGKIVTQLKGGTHNFSICRTYNPYERWGSPYPNEWQEGSCLSDSISIYSDLILQIYYDYIWIINSNRN